MGNLVIDFVKAQATPKDCDLEVVAVVVLLIVGIVRAAAARMIADSVSSRSR